MPSHRLGSPMVAIAVLITVSVLFVITIAEGFKAVNDGGENDGGDNQVGVWWKRREMQSGMPLGALWSRAFSSQHDVERGAFQLSSMVGVISDAAGKLVDSGVSDAISVATQSNSATPANTAGPVPGVMAEVDNVINPSAEGVAQTVNAATEAVGSLLASASDVSNIGVLADAIASVTSASGSDVQEATSVVGTALASATALAGSTLSRLSSMAGSALGTVYVSSSAPAAASMADSPPAYPEGDNWPAAMPSSSSGLRNNSISMLANTISSSAKNTTTSMAIYTSAAKNISMSALAQSSIAPIMASAQTAKPQNMSSMAAQSSSKPIMPPMPQNNTLPRPMNSSCPVMTVISECPVPVTETCTVTETWFSTQYSDTVTMYSFMDVLTITCTETISDCIMGPPAMTISSNGTYMQMPAADPQHSSLPKYAHIAGAHSSKLGSLPQPGASAELTKASLTIQLLTESATPSSLSKLITDENLVFCADGSMAASASMCPDGGAQSPSLIMVKAGPQKLPREDNTKTETITAILDATLTPTVWGSTNRRDEKEIFSMNAMRGGSFKKAKRDVNGDGLNEKESTK